MKRLMVSCVVLFIVGCAAPGPIKNIIRDEQFSGYKMQLEQLEKDYLQKKISYVQYLEDKKRIEEDYQKQIDGRRDLIQNQNTPSAATEMVP